MEYKEEERLSHDTDLFLAPPNGETKDIERRVDLYDDDRGFLLYGLLSHDECKSGYLCTLTVQVNIS